MSSNDFSDWKNPEFSALGNKFDGTMRDIINSRMDAGRMKKASRDKKAEYVEPLQGFNVPAGTAESEDLNTKRLVYSMVQQALQTKGYPDDLDELVAEVRKNFKDPEFMKQLGASETPVDEGEEMVDVDEEETTEEEAPEQLGGEEPVEEVVEEEEPELEKAPWFEEPSEEEPAEEVEEVTEEVETPAEEPSEEEFEVAEEVEEAPKEEKESSRRAISSQLISDSLGLRD